MPVEHIWEDIREHLFYNQAFSSLEQVEDVLCQGLLELSSNCDRLRSMTYFPHLPILPLTALYYQLINHQPSRQHGDP